MSSQRLTTRHKRQCFLIAPSQRRICTPDTIIIYAQRLHEGDLARRTAEVIAIFVFVQVVDPQIPSLVICAVRILREINSAPRFRRATDIVVAVDAVGALRTAIMPFILIPGVVGAVMFVSRTSSVSPKRKAIRRAVVKAVHLP